MPLVKGVVSKRYDNDKNVVLEVNGGRYSAQTGKFIGPEIQAGSTVEFIYAQNGKWMNIDSDVVSSGTGAAPAAGALQGAPVTGGVDARQRMILRQNAVTNANAFCSQDPTVTKEFVVQTARYFESYYDGSLDATEQNQLGGPDVPF
jgi:hypothetical protein